MIYRPCLYDDLSAPGTAGGRRPLESLHCALGEVLKRKRKSQLMGDKIWTDGDLLVSFQQAVVRLSWTPPCCKCSTTTKNLVANLVGEHIFSWWHCDRDNGGGDNEYFMVTTTKMVTNMMVTMTKIPWQHPLPPPHNGWWLLSSFHAPLRAETLDKWV